jgi:hypothetical protein
VNAKIYNNLDMQITNITSKKEEHFNNILTYLKQEYGDIFSDKILMNSLIAQQYNDEMEFDLDGTKFYYDDIIRYYSSHFPKDSPNREILKGRVCGVIEFPSKRSLYVQPQGSKYCNFVDKEDIIERTNIL